MGIAGLPFSSIPVLFATNSFEKREAMRVQNPLSNVTPPQGSPGQVELSNDPSPGREQSRARKSFEQAVRGDDH